MKGRRKGIENQSNDDKNPQQAEAEAAHVSPAQPMEGENRENRPVEEQRSAKQEAQDVARPWSAWLRNLDRDKRQELFNGTVAFAAGIGIVFAVIQVIAIITGSIATQKGLRLTRDTLKETQRSNQTAQETAYAQLRPWWLVHSAGVQPMKRAQKRIFVGVKFKNVGTTPATDISPIIQIDVLDKCPSVPLKFGQVTEEPSMNSAGAGQELELFVALPIDSPKAVSWIQGKKNLYVWGKVTYRDTISDLQHETTFSVYATPRTVILRDCSKGNTAN